MAKTRPHIPTAKTLSQVRMGAMLGVPPHDIAKLLGITKGQLLKFYVKELATGPARAGEAVRVATRPLAKERGELINRSAQLDTCETASRMIERAIMRRPMWTEEAVGIYRTGGDSAFRQWLRAKAVEACDSLADLIKHPTTLVDPCIRNGKKSGTRSERT